MVSFAAHSRATRDNKMINKMRRRLCVCLPAGGGTSWAEPRVAEGEKLGQSPKKKNIVSRAPLPPPQEKGRRRLVPATSLHGTPQLHPGLTSSHPPSIGGTGNGHFWFHFLLCSPSRPRCLTIYEETVFFSGHRKGECHGTPLKWKGPHLLVFCFDHQLELNSI